MRQYGDDSQQCKFCDETDELSFVAVSGSDVDAADELDPQKKLWLCQKHYKRLIQADEYRIRELPTEGGELGHSSRDEVQEQGTDYVVIVDDGDDDRWFKAPDRLELDLKSER